MEKAMNLVEKVIKAFPKQQNFRQNDGKSHEK
jgi:hypothetical protein